MGFPRKFCFGHPKKQHRALGNAVVPQVAEVIGRLIVESQ